jgi:hypothetical protein
MIFTDRPADRQRLLSLFGLYHGQEKRIEDVELKVLINGKPEHFLPAVELDPVLGKSVTLETLALISTNSRTSFRPKG